MDNNYYVYLHIRLDNGQPFYVGKGKGNRYINKRSRNKIWKNIVNKYDYDVLFLEENLTEEQSLEKEKYWIERIGRKDLSKGPLINLTDGGEGTSKIIVTEETKRKLSEKSKGNKYGLGYKHTEETKKIISKTGKGRKHSEETKKNISEKNKGVNNGMYGKIAHNRGKKHTEETKNKRLKTIIKNSPAIYSINIETNDRVDYTSIYDVMEKNPTLNRSYINKVLNGHNKTYNGFKWFYTVNNK